MPQDMRNQTYPSRRAYVSDEQEDNTDSRPMMSGHTTYPSTSQGRRTVAHPHAAYLPEVQRQQARHGPTHQAQTFPSRRAYVSDEQEGEASTSTRPITPDYELDEHLTPSPGPLSDILGFDSRAMEFLGRDLLSSIEQAGRNLPVGTAANRAARASATSGFFRGHGNTVSAPAHVTVAAQAHVTAATTAQDAAPAPTDIPDRLLNVPENTHTGDIFSSFRGHSINFSRSARVASTPPRPVGADNNFSGANAAGTGSPPGDAHNNFSRANAVGAFSPFEDFNNISRTTDSRGTSSFARGLNGGVRGLNNNSSSTTHPFSVSSFPGSTNASSNFHGAGSFFSSGPNQHSDHATIVAPTLGRGAQPAPDDRLQNPAAPVLAGASSNTENIVAHIRDGAANTSVIATPILAGTSRTNRVTAPILAGASTRMIAAPNSSTAIMSTEYQGDPSIVENYSAPIPQEQSTSLFIKYLPPDTTVARILAHIHSTGKIWSLHVNPPTPPHSHSAAKICFFTRAAAAKFYLDSLPGFLVDGHRATVLWNRVLVPEHVGSQWDDASRVVIVRGPRDVVSMRAVADIVHAEIRIYDLVRVFEEDDAKVEGWTEVEVHFGSFRAQGHSAYIVLNRAFRGRGVEISYGIDPCA